MGYFLWLLCGFFIFLDVKREVEQMRNETNFVLILKFLFFTFFLFGFRLNYISQVKRD